MKAKPNSNKRGRKEIQEEKNYRKTLQLRTKPQKA